MEQGTVPGSRQRFAAFIADARAAAGLNQKELAEALGIDKSLVNKWERASQLPSTKYLPDLARVLRLDPVDLVVRQSNATLDELKEARRDNQALTERITQLIDIVGQLVAELRPDLAAGLPKPDR